MEKDKWNAYHNAWDKENTVMITVKLNKRTDADILDRLRQVDSKSGYIKRLIRSDIKNNGI